MSSPRQMPAALQMFAHHGKPLRGLMATSSLSTIPREVWPNIPIFTGRKVWQQALKRAVTL